MIEQTASSDLIDSSPASCDLSFMEAISQKMRIPNRLKVTEEPGDEERAEDIQMSTLHMQIPERISMGGKLFQCELTRDVKINGYLVIFKYWSRSCFNVS